VVKKYQLKSKDLKSLIRQNVDIEKTTLMTDQYRGYAGIQQIMAHKVINHSIWYVDGDMQIPAQTCHPFRNKVATDSG